MTIQDIADEIIADTQSDLSATLMMGYMKDGMRFIPARVRSRLFVTEATLSLASGASTVLLTGLTSNFVRERSVWYLNDSGDKEPISKPSSAGYFQRNLVSASTSGKPLFYVIQGQTLRFDKPADATITIGLDYFKEVSQGLALTDTFAGDEVYLLAIKCFTKSEYYSQYEEDINKGQEYERKGEKVLLSLDEDYQEQELGGYVEETEYY